MSRKIKFPVLITGLILICILGILVSIGTGYYSISIEDIFRVLFMGELEGTPEYTVLFRIRLPRISAALIIGAALSMSGCVYQGIFKNPLASPDILGVTSGAGLGAALAIYLELPHYLVQVSAFFFGIGVVGLTYLANSRIRYQQTISLVLTGTMLGTVCTSLVSLLKYLADPHDKLPAITYWLMGSLAKLQVSDLLFSLPFFLCGCLLLFLLRWKCNLLTLDDQEAATMGIRPGRVRLLAVTAATLLSASAICIGGQIGWIGLMIPHIARYLAGADYRKMLPAAFLLGAFFLLMTDNLCRSLFSVELPLGIVTSLLGAPFFLLILFKYRWRQHNA